MSSNARERILDAAWALVRERGPSAVTLAEVGRAAGVSRQAVYLHFESRAGLFTAMARRHDEASGFDESMAAATALPPAEALERMLRLWCAYIPQILPVARPLEAASVTGDDAAAAWHDRMADLRRAFRFAIRRMDAEGGLADGWSVEEAADWAWARTHPKAYDALVGDRGWSPEAFTERVVSSVLRELCKSDSAGRL